VTSDEGDDSAIALSGGKSQWTARVAARSLARPGQQIELGVDTGNLHFFDPSSTVAIGRGDQLLPYPDQVEMSG
jgi:multiple sugar transport system ATP-binding protein